MSSRLGTALGASVLISSPVLWMLQQGTLSPGIAVQRWAICLAVCWLAITVVGSFAFPAAPSSPPATSDQTQPEQAPADVS